MPSVETWLTSPKGIIQHLFENRKSNSDDWLKEVYDYFGAKILDSTYQQLIPVLNGKHRHEVKENQLVRFRCMIQDSRGGEFFDATVQDSNGAVYTHHFQDNLQLSEAVPSEGGYGSRESYYCVSVPGESSWVREKYASSNVQPTSSGHYRKECKRDYEEMEGCEKNDAQVGCEDPQQESRNKRLKTTAAADVIPVPQAAESLNENHRSPQDVRKENDSVCILKIYPGLNGGEDLKINQVFDVYGILSVGLGNEEAMDEADAGPKSFVPHLHCVAISDPLVHTNPIPIDLMSEGENFKAASLVCMAQMMAILTKVTFGDELTAQYLLLHLISRVHRFEGETPVGRMSLNITNAPNRRYPTFIARLLDHFLTKLHFFSMSLQQLNQQRFVPKKNYDTMCLEPGVLQTPENFQFVIDELQLESGQLQAQGVRNMDALMLVIKSQSVSYDFTFNAYPFRHTIMALVVSEAKSILPCDVRIPLQPQEPIPENLDSFLDACLEEVGAVHSSNLRGYLTAATFRQSKMGTEGVSVAGDDFVKVRKDEGPDAMTANDFSLLLTIADNLANLEGCSTTGTTHWQNARQLETARKARLGK